MSTLADQRRFLSEELETVCGLRTFAAQLMTVVAIYSAVSIRDAALNQQLGQTLMKGQYPRLNRLRRDPHDASGECWLHGSGFCLSA